MAYNNYMAEDSYHKKKQPGCFVSWSMWFIILLIVAILITTAVLITYYVPQSSCDATPTTDPYMGLPPPPEQPQDVHNPTNGRLPDNVKPSHYKVDIKTYLDEPEGGSKDKQFTFEGTVEIDITCQETTHVITLHAHRTINALSATVTHLPKTGQPTDIEVIDWDTQPKQPEFEFLNINLGSSIEVGESYLLTIDYEGTLLQPDLLGYYVSNYTVNGEERHLACTQFGLSYARRGFPCFDEPQLKATFDIILEHRDGRRALSNMPVTKTEEPAVGWTRTYFDTTPTMSAYVIALVVADYVNITRYTESGIPVSVWAWEENIHAFEYAVEMATQQVDIFTRAWGVPYTLPKLDNVAIPNFYFSGMENWGVILYRDTRIAYEAGIDTPYQAQRSNSLVSHEVAHQWFGDIVTCKWWDHTWLNEGITSFVEFIGTNHTEPDWQVFEQIFQWTDLYPAMRADSIGDSHPIVYSVGTTSDEILAAFGILAYQKGASLTQMMVDFLTKETFTSGITQYIKKHNHSNVESDDLFEVLTEADAGKTKLNVKLIMDTWILQMGYPVVSVTRDVENPSIIHTDQEHFLLDPEDEPTDKYGDMGYKWYVMLTYTHDGERAFENPGRTWQNRGPVSIQLNGATANDWVLFNIHQAGYYRVKYENDNLDKLAVQLKTDHEVIPVRSRAALLSDSFTLADGHQLDELAAWKLTEYLDDEKEYIPWRTTTDSLGRTKIMLKRTSAYGHYEKYMRHQISPLYGDLGWQFTLDDLLNYLNRLVGINVACAHGHTDCVDECKKQYTDWMTTGNNSMIRDDTKAVVYCIAIRYGGEAEWQFAMDMYESKITPAGDRSYLQTSMACTHIPWLLTRYMEYSMAMDWATIGIRNVRKYSPVGFSIAWSFALDHFDDLYETYGDAAYYTMWEFSEEMNTDRDKNDLEMFARAHSDMSESAASNFYDALHIIDRNIMWMDRNYQPLYLWFGEVTKEMPN
ncbi:aminopeptidase N-like [Glandiceps talaboti]